MTRSRLTRKIGAMAQLRDHHAGVGSRLEHPQGVGRLTVLRSAEQTDGLLTEVEAICEPGTPGVAERSFESHDVAFEVIDGRLTVGVRGEERRVRAGQGLDLPAGTPHRIWVEADRGPARFIWRMRPAGSTADLLALVFGERTENDLLPGTQTSKTGEPHV